MLSLTALRLRTAARNAARIRDWTAAATAYRAYLDRRPQDAKAWVQYGHVAKEAGDMEAAVTAYGRALDEAPDAAEIWFHLSHACKRLGDRAAATDCCARAAALDPTFTEATEELVALGARDRIPLGQFALNSTPPAIVPRTASRHSPALDATVYAPSRYATFRRHLAISPPPANASSDTVVTVMIDAGVALPIDVRATLSSLLDQQRGHWRAIVHAPTAIATHSVASLAALDSRIRFVASNAPPPDPTDAPHVLLVAAGTMLDPQAIAWFDLALRRTGCVAAYCDHDRAVDDWRTGRTFTHPVFYPMFDPLWTPDGADAPAAVLIDQSRLAVLPGHDRDGWLLLRRAAAVGAVVHIPLLLASRKVLADQAEQAPPDAPTTGLVSPPPPEALPTHKAAPHDHPPARVQVVIQTRDEAAMLRACIDSLRDKATRSDLLDITIVDNRSVERATQQLLERYRRSRVATILPLDEPFNWSRANNLAAAAGTAPLLLFLNNDTEMLTAGWDDALRHALSPAQVGIVGATLLYPDTTLQHAGIVMGMGNGGPVHEGIGRSITDGPGDRWRRSRSAAAVTGAFLAIRRDVYDLVEGFDALNFAIAFNDIDLCLRVRAAGFRVIMPAGIVMTHHESKTRGMNVTRSQIAWDLDELGRLYDRWGNAVFDDPAYNPHWTRTGQPFDGYRMPPLRDVMRWIDVSAGAQPWAPVVTRDEPDWW